MKGRCSLILPTERCLPVSPLYGVQNLLNLWEKLVELIFRSGNVDYYRLASDVHDGEPIPESLIT